ncbi:hypothetical protein CAEBREN_16167 [Caenorhabditis brenneri]|uniref:Uncharacterized protein n=1 Tax=Caenorhabditis brenneri TaxID=135651 RepID=G0MQX1_CAEBE|nr:hypothetical protein CAEBREN_16167 [Caenorhabditis brenneri]
MPSTVSHSENITTVNSIYKKNMDFRPKFAFIQDSDAMTDGTSCVFVKNFGFFDDSKSNKISKRNNIGTQLTVICDNFKIDMTSSLEFSSVHNISSTVTAVSSDFGADSGFLDVSKTSSISNVGHDIGTKLAAMCDDFDDKIMSCSEFSTTNDSDVIATTPSSALIEDSGLLDDSKTNNTGHNIGMKLAKMCDDFDDEMMAHSKFSVDYDAGVITNTKVPILVEDSGFLDDPKLGYISHNIGVKQAVMCDNFDKEMMHHSEFVSMNDFDVMATTSSSRFGKDSGFFDDSKHSIISNIGYDIGTKVANMCDDFDAKLMSYSKFSSIHGFNNTPMTSSSYSLDIISDYSVIDDSTSSNISDIDYVIGKQSAVLCDDSEVKTMSSTSRSLLKTVFERAWRVFGF